VRALRDGFERVRHLGRMNGFGDGQSMDAQHRWIAYATQDRRAERGQRRCQRGADIARQLRFGEGVAAGIHSLDEHWDGSGKPDGLRGAETRFLTPAQVKKLID